MSCEQPICRIVTCKPTDDLPSYFGTYSLQNGTFFTNNPIVIPLPGGGYYVYKPDQITIVVPNNPTSIGYQGCQSMVSVPVPAGATDLEIAGLVSAVMREVAEQQAGCDGILIPVGPKSTWVNTRQIAICVDGPEMKLVGTLPAGVTFDISGLSVAAGIFTSKKSQQDADLRAFQYVNDALSVVQCGWWNEEQNFVCPDSSIVTVPANTYFSQVSQDAANADALAFAETQCTSGGRWSHLLWQVPTLVGNASFVPDSAEDASFTCDAFVTTAAAPSALCENNATLDYNEAGFSSNLHIEFNWDIGASLIFYELSLYIAVYDSLNNLISEPLNESGSVPLVPGPSMGSNSLDFPLVLPDSAGDTYQIRVQVDVLINCGIQPVIDSRINVTSATFTD